MSAADRGIWAPQYLSSNIDDLRFGEAYLELATIIMGKYIRDSSKPHTLRDTTLSYDENGNILVSSSSTARYPQIWQYHEGYFNLKFAKTEQQVICDICNQSKSVLNEIDLKRYLKSYLNKRFDKFVCLVTQTKIGILWAHLPANIKELMRKTYGYIYGNKTNNAVLNDESNIVIKVIREYDKYYS